MVTGVGRMAIGVIQAWRGQPRQLFGLCLTEMWERFGFVTMTALKLLFLVAPVSAFGLGWNQSVAFSVLAWVSVTIYMAPLLGGWISDTLLGQKRAILLGGVLMALGYLSLGSLPYVLNIWSPGGLDMQAVLAAEQLPLAQFTPDAAAVARVSGRILAATGGDATAVSTFHQLYRAQSGLLAAALLLIIVGNGLFKPSVSSLVGSLYRVGDARRDGGFTLFWTCINVGSFLAMVIGGGVGERLGWHYGFFCAAIGMAGGLVVFLRIRHTLPDWVKPVRIPRRDVQATMTTADRKRLAAILLMVGFAIIFNATHGQIFGLIPLFVLEDVERTIAGFEVPALWITSLNPLLILLAAPATAALWDLLGQRGRNPSFASKFALAMALLSVGQIVLTLAALEAEGAVKASLSWIGVSIVLLSLAEIPLQPIGLAMVTKLTPPRLVSTMIGVWLLNYAFAAWLGNMVAAQTERLGLATVFGIGATSCVVATILLLLLKRSLDAWMVPPEFDEPVGVAVRA